jgi:hypothetical protein
MFRLRPRLLLTATFIIGLTLFLYTYGVHSPWSTSTSPVGFHGSSFLQQELASLNSALPPSPPISDVSRHNFTAGAPLAAGHNYTRTLVVPRTKTEDVWWLDEEVQGYALAVYVVDDTEAPLHPPVNKGNEAMVYLSYIIDHYDQLADITVFIHSHRWAWHNNDLLDADMAMMLRHLLPQRIIREGYANLRCQWYPGCPTWLNTEATSINAEKKEELLVQTVWAELFPDAPMPSALAQTCCSQFALSRERIRAVPLAEYVRLRDWLMNTTIRDSMTGRLFEYLWQYLWTAKPVHCPSQHACYCDLYGACFISEVDFQAWFETRYYLRQDEWELLGWQLAGDARKKWLSKGNTREADQIEKPADGVLKDLKDKISMRWIELLERRERAFELGKNPKMRATIAGRLLDAGDGVDI